VADAIGRFMEFAKTLLYLPREVGRHLLIRNRLAE
jgi:hypothetical protein